MKIKNTVLLIAVFYAFVTVAWALPVSVTTFGAVGNNVADDRIPIQNAINSLPPAGGTVYFPPGLYKVSGTIYVPSNVRIQGMGSTVYNTQIRLAPTHTILFEIDNGASNVVFKDLALVAASSPVWPRNTATETALIRTEGTTAISFKAGTRDISNVVIENVRATMFTYGISAPSAIGANNLITDIKIRNYVSDGNEYSLYTDMPGADNWDVQNMNVYPMYAGQNGIFLERSGAMRFLQLSCAGAGAGICAKLWDNGELYFREMHVEGPRLGICVGGNCQPDGPAEKIEENDSKITIENSATDGEFNRFTNLVSINNRFWLDFPQPPAPAPTPYRFYGTGTTSALRSCGNVWVSWNPATHMSNTTVIPPAGTFPGLTTTGTPTPYHEYQQCLRSDLTSVPVFNTGYEPDNERFTGEINVTSAPYYAVPNDGIDDTPAFQAALTAAANLANRGRRVFVPTGTFEINSTLDLNPASGTFDGVTFLGEAGSTIRLKVPSISLFRVVNGNGYPINGITFRNLTLMSDYSTGTIGINFENFSSTTVGAASDFQIQNVDFYGFDTGIAVRPVGGVLTNPNPMFDSVSIKDGDFVGNNTAILTRSGNASNWNLEDIRVTLPNAGEGVRMDSGGHISTRNLSCNSFTGTGTACATIQRQSGVAIESMTAANVTNALVVRWENGWTQFPVTLRNNDLREGVYFQGRTYLNSVNNIFPAKLRKFSTARDVRFAAYLEGDPWNVAYGGQSNVYTCDDTFRDTSAFLTSYTWVYTGTLSTPETYCY